MILQAQHRSFAEPDDARTIVKICGITQPEHALAAQAAGADMVGMVFFPKSHRRVSVGAARGIADAISSAENRPLCVGVFVNEPLSLLREIATAARLDVLQLSGDESPEEVIACAEYYPVVKALRFPGGVSAEEAIEVMDSYTSVVPKGRVRLLVDTHSPGEYGGTGQTADWPLARALSACEDIILAGGLKPDNIAEALRVVSPWGVDVSSGVELNGSKDPTLIEEFIRAARSARGRKDA